MSSLQKNLTEGSVWKQLIMFSLPLMLSNFIQSAYNIADMIIVGQFAGTYSLSGVNIGGQITLIITSMVIGLSVGGTVLIGQYSGAGNHKALKETIGTLFSTLIILAVFLTVVMLFLRKPVLHLIQTPKESFDEALRYFTVTACGLIFIFAYNALSAVMRGLGNSKTPLIFVAVACVVNIGLDLLLVAVFNMAAIGAAIATVFSQALSVVLCVIYLKRRDFVFDFKFSSLRFNKERFKILVKIGVPTSVQYTVTSISFMFMTTIANIIGGAPVSAALGSVGKFNTFATLPSAAMNSAISAIAAQNIGANKSKRAVKTMYIGLVIAWVFSAVIFVLVQIWPEFVLKMFNNDADYISAGTLYLKYFSIDFLVLPLLMSVNGFIIGTGHSIIPLCSSVLASVVARVPSAYLFGIELGFGVRGLGFVAPLSTFVAFVLSACYYLSGKWKNTTILSEK